MEYTHKRRGSKDYPPNLSLMESSTETRDQPPPYKEDPGLDQGRPDPTTMNSSQKYKDIISRSTVISSGSPAAYKLKPKRTKNSALLRMTVGEKNPNKINKIILLVGETGAGKSTLVNALLNYSMGVKWEEEVWFQIVEEHRRQIGSQTTDVIVYEIFGFEGKTLPYSLTIIDTPGFGDTRGIKRDDIISQKLLDLFGSERGVHELHAVGLVMKASENQLSDRQRYIFDSVMSLFGKNMEESIVALITHSDGVTPEDALTILEDVNIKCANNEKNQPVHFMFNNRQKEQRTEENESGLEKAWKVSEKGMKKFTTFLETSEPQDMKKTAEVLKERIRLTASIQNLQERIKHTELKQTEIRQVQEALRKHEEEMKMNEEFTVEADEVYREKEPIDGGWWGLGLFYNGAVCCKVCKENCHYPCEMARSPDGCKVIKNGHCIVCTKKCPVSDHVKEQWRYVTKVKKVQRTIDSVKERYEKNKSEHENKSSVLENLKIKMNQLRAEKSQFLDESYQHVVTLEQIALKPDSASTVVHLDFLIDKMKEKGDTEKVQKLEEMRRAVDDGTRSAMQFLSRNISTKFKGIISRSTLIHSGSPAVYQLNPKVEKTGTLTRLTVGEKNLNKIIKTILLVGETGAGKSTLVNALINHSIGVKWEDKVFFQIVEEKRRQIGSQTTDVIVYEIFGFEDKTLPYSLTIIDTPGFGNTRGKECDDIIGRRLLDLFRSEDGVHELHAVGLVMKASENRLSDRQRYIFDSVMSLFGKNMEENIVALITHSDGVTPENILKAFKDVNFKCARNEKNQSAHFMFNNRQQEQRTEENESGLEDAWEVSEKGIKKFTTFLETSEPQDMKKTV